jgi:hypothetical protein
MVRKILNPRNGDRGSTPREIRYLLLVKKGERKPTSAIKTYVKHDRTWTGVEWSKHSVLFENQDLGVGGRRRRAAVGGSRLGVVVHGGAFERVRNLGMRARTRTHTMRQSQRPQSATPERQAGGGRGGGGGQRPGPARWQAGQAQARRPPHLWACAVVPAALPSFRHRLRVAPPHPEASSRRHLSRWYSTVRLQEPVWKSGEGLLIYFFPFLRCGVCLSLAISSNAVSFLGHRGWVSILFGPIYNRHFFICFGACFCACLCMLSFLYVQRNVNIHILLPFQNTCRHWLFSATLIVWLYIAIQYVF